MNKCDCYNCKNKRAILDKWNEVVEETETVVLELSAVEFAYINWLIEAIHDPKLINAEIVMMTKVERSTIRKILKAIGGEVIEPSQKELEAEEQISAQAAEAFKFVQLKQAMDQVLGGLPPTESKSDFGGLPDLPFKSGGDLN